MRRTRRIGTPGIGLQHCSLDPQMGPTMCRCIESQRSTVLLGCWCSWARKLVQKAEAEQGAEAVVGGAVLMAVDVMAVEVTATVARAMQALMARSTPALDARSTPARRPSSPPLDPLAAHSTPALDAHSTTELGPLDPLAAASMEPLDRATCGGG